MEKEKERAEDEARVPHRSAQTLAGLNSAQPRQTPGQLQPKAGENEVSGTAPETPASVASTPWPSVASQVRDLPK